MAEGEKTEKATPKRRRDAREKEGSVLQSNEVLIAVSVLGSFLVFSALASYMYQMLVKMLGESITLIGQQNENSIEFFTAKAVYIVQMCIMIAAPLMIIIAVIAVLTVIVQTKGLFSMKPLKPKFSNLSPLKGIKKMFSMQSIVSIVKGIIEITVIIVIIYLQLSSRMTEIGSLVNVEPIQGTVYIAETTFNIVMMISILLVFIGAGDFVFQWWQFEKKLKMSKQEIKDEYKQMEGDPQIKSKIKQKQREISQRRMMDEVPKSDVVIRNPTHFAVALKYDANNPIAAPRVVAKGQDSLAFRIIEIAQANNVYVVENRPLARELYEKVDIGKEIPPSFFSAVAVIISEMFSKKGINVDLN